MGNRARIATSGAPRYPACQISCRWTLSIKAKCQGYFSPDISMFHGCFENAANLYVYCWTHEQLDAAILDVWCKCFRGHLRTLISHVAYMHWTFPWIYSKNWGSAAASRICCILFFLQDWCLLNDAIVFLYIFKLPWKKMLREDYLFLLHGCGYTTITERMSFAYWMTSDGGRRGWGWNPRISVH
jgi:hypothetical protein